MKIYNGLIPYALSTNPVVVTLGLFDGVHVGHQHVLKSAKEEAIKLSGELAVLTFNSLPKAINTLITTVYHKKKLLEQLGVDHLVEISFPEVKNLSPEAFLHAVTVMFPTLTWVVGEDVHFGVGRLGDRILLEKYTHGNVVIVRPYVRGEFSSTHVRENIQKGDLEKVSFLLGRTYSILSEAKRSGTSVMNFDGKGLCLPPVGEWQALARFEGDSCDHKVFCTISSNKVISIKFLGKIELPQMRYVEIFSFSKGS